MQNHQRPWRGRVARDKPVARRSPSARSSTCAPSSRTWPCGGGPNDRPPAPLRQRHPTPRQAAAQSSPARRRPGPHGRRGGLADPFARTGLAILRGTGMRLGELLDLELDCLWDFGGRGTWVKVPFGKLGTERTVPLDEATLADFDAWISHRGPQRALPHPRHGQPADFLFVERGRRLSAYRLRHGSMTPLRPRACAAGTAKPCTRPRTSSGTPMAPAWSTRECRYRR